MPAKAFPISTIVYARSLSVVSAFYEHALQLERTESESTYMLLSSGTIEIAVVRIPEPVAAQFTVSVPPTLRADTALKMCFLVESFESVRDAAERTGGSLEAEEAAWSWRGHRHLDGNDPEGNIVQFRVAEALPPP